MGTVTIFRENGKAGWAAIRGVFEATVPTLPRAGKRRLASFPIPDEGDSSHSPSGAGA